jgi:ABC-type multidrug transport system fused ATPase/permease subunit
VVTIAHRLAPARDAHRVVVIQSGQIIEQGTPTALLAADGTFAALNAPEEAGWDWQHEPDAR